MPEHQWNIRSLLGGLFGLPGKIDWWWHVGLPGVGSLVTAIFTYWQAEPFLLGLLSAIAIYVALFVIGMFARRHLRNGNSSASLGSGPAIYVSRVSGDMNIQQQPPPFTGPEPEVSSDRYREGESIRIADLAREDDCIRLGHEIVCDRTFRNCRVLGPAALFVQQPQEPMTFIGCRWREGENAFSVTSPERYVGSTELVRLHQCIFWGCRFENVEMLVSQETYNRYINGETAL